MELTSIARPEMTDDLVGRTVTAIVVEDGALAVTFEGGSLLIAAFYSGEGQVQRIDNDEDVWIVGR